ncbi:MAG: FAD-binding protein [Bifidobacteriaceae bacterium]|jgi:fumarate reductase flavoprotein subunit|nr:FAD-binding protein [Bifidobacteriaceae bacterium]
MKNLVSLDRRNFLKVGAFVTASAAAVGGLAACSPSAKKEEEEAEKTEEPQIPTDIKQTYNTDICIIGAGSSGLTAAVQAGLNGKKVLVLESTGSTGGGAIGIEGIFGAGSKLQAERGIEVHTGNVMHDELKASQYRANGPAYRDMIAASGPNIDWLVDQGVEFENVSEYGEIGVNSTFQAFHWFKGGRGNTGYVPQMTAKAEEVGAEFLFNTTAESLIVQDGVVKGAYAAGEDGYIQVNAGAVILADGGFSANDDLLIERGFDPDQIVLIGMPTSLGDGLQMAIRDAGARNTMAESAFAMTNTVGTLDPMGSLAFVICFGGPFLWINDQAERFVGEDLASENMEIQCQPTLNFEHTYMVFDQAIFDSVTGGDAELASIWEEQVTDNLNEDVFKADNLEDLPGKLGLDQAVFLETVNRYNQLCDEGDDRDFGKDPALMKKIETGPFYLCRFHYALLVTFGGVHSNRKFEVLDTDKNPIPGLYAAGVNSGYNLWRNVYTINVGGGSNANNINSGRGSANSATEYLS